MKLLKRLIKHAKKVFGIQAAQKVDEVVPLNINPIRISNMCDPTARQFATSYNHCCRWKPLNTLNLYLEQITQNKPTEGLLDYILVPLMTENIQNHHISLLSVIIVVECI